MTEILFKLIDYSSGTISGEAIKAKGYTGAIRYITAPKLMNPPRMNQKHITPTEYQSHKAAGRIDWFVFQGSTTDADGGWDLGVHNADLARQGLEYIGAPLDSPVFFTNDRPTLPNPAAWKDYLRGARSVLGRCGAYGFRNAIDAAWGIADYYWQCGRQSDVREGVHVYQWNNGSDTVGGRTCDINYVYKTIGDTMSAADAYNGFADALKDMAAGNAEDLRKALVRVVWTAELAVPAFPENPTAEARIALTQQKLADLTADVGQVEQALTTVQAAQGGVNQATLDVIRTELAPLFDLAARLKD